jgi:general secretion pathway protein G
MFPGHRKLIGIAILTLASFTVSVGVPKYQQSSLRDREARLKYELMMLRTVIAEFTFDKKSAPATLDALVEQRYLRAVPVDPITGSNRTWRVVREDSSGIQNLHSASDRKSLDGSRYSEW